MVAACFGSGLLSDALGAAAGVIEKKVQKMTETVPHVGVKGPWLGLAVNNGRH